MDEIWYWFIFVMLLIIPFGTLMYIWTKRRVKKLLIKLATLTGAYCFICLFTFGVIIETSQNILIDFLISFAMACLGYLVFIGYLKLLRNLRKKLGKDTWDFFDR